MVRVLVLFVQHSVGGHHVVHDVGLADLFRAELLGSREVPAVVIAEVVVRHDRRRLDARAHEEVYQDRFHLSLAGLEVVPADVRLVLLGKLDHPGDERVLRSLSSRCGLRCVGSIVNR